MMPPPAGTVAPFFEDVNVGDEHEEKRAEFADRAKFFFTHVQGLQDQGLYRSRTDSNLLEKVDDQECEDIWE